MLSDRGQMSSITKGCQPKDRPSKLHSGTERCPRSPVNHSWQLLTRPPARQRLIVLEGVGLIGIGLRPQAATLEDPADTPDSPGRPGDFGIRRRRSRMETDAAPFVLGVHAIEGQHV